MKASIPAACSTKTKSVFLQGGGFALDREALMRAGLDEREARARVIALGALEVVSGQYELALSRTNRSWRHPRGRSAQQLAQLSQSSGRRFARLVPPYSSVRDRVALRDCDPDAVGCDDEGLWVVADVDRRDDARGFRVDS
jgi:hypothetical protein